MLAVARPRWLGRDQAGMEKGLTVDMVKQALAGILGSMALAGCLSDQTILQVSETEQEEVDQDEESDDSAAIWPADRFLGPGSVPLMNSGSLPADGRALLAQSVRSAGPNHALTAGLAGVFLSTRAEGRSLALRSLGRRRGQSCSLRTARGVI